MFWSRWIKYAEDKDNDTLECVLVMSSFGIIVGMVMGLVSIVDSSVTLFWKMFASMSAAGIFGAVLLGPDCDSFKEFVLGIGTGVVSALFGCGAIYSIFYAPEWLWIIGLSLVGMEAGFLYHSKTYYTKPKSTMLVLGRKLGAFLEALVVVSTPIWIRDFLRQYWNSEYLQYTWIVIAVATTIAVFIGFLKLNQIISIKLIEKRDKK